MKTAFSILPEAGTEKQLHLLIEAGRDCISMLWYSKDRLSLQGLIVYQPEAPADDETLASALQKKLASENLPHYNSCRIFYNLKESILLPSPMLQSEGKHEMLELMYCEDTSASLEEETVPSLNAANIYRVPFSLKKLMDDRFYGAPIKHSTSCQVSAATNWDLYCIIYPSSIKILCSAQGQLQLAQVYDYKTPADVSYYLLQVCQQHQIDPATASVLLAGFIDKDSHLFQDIYRYFLNIEILPVPDDISVSESLQELPAQFYSFLIPLLQCES